MAQHIIQISTDDFFALGKLITDRYGIRLPIEKRILFQSRLQSRLKELQFSSFAEYRQFVLNPENREKELLKMIDHISTNKTEFFREPRHFDLLSLQILPDLIREFDKNNTPLIHCWSAGCSSGQEAYSLAMVVSKFLSAHTGSYDYSIVGTDVSGKMLAMAERGVYPFSQSENIPESYLKEYVLKSKGDDDKRIKISKNIRSKIRFIRSNLMDDVYTFNQKFSIIFLRNTLIYFSRDDQQKILQKVLNFLEDNGYLFIGHSESLINLDLPIQIVAPSLYKKCQL